MRNTIGDVAKEAGVSITTVSRVVNNNYPVNANTKAKVEKAIEKLNFTPNALARGLIIKKTFAIGVVVPSMTNLFFPEVVRGIESVLQEKKYVLFLSETMEDEEKEIKIINKMLERQVDGIIVMGASTTNIKNGFFEKITKEVPFLIINGYNKGIHSNFVLTDEEMGTLEALEYLYKLGHRNIGFLRGGRSYSYDLKEETFKIFLEKKGIELDKENILEIKSGNNLDSVEDAKSIVMDRLKMKNPLTAIFCCNDWMATGAVKGIEEIGFKVPEDISIIGFDNILISQINSPKITTVNQNMDKIGNSAAELLLEIIDKGHENNNLKKIILETSLIKRESCRENIIKESFNGQFSI